MVSQRHHTGMSCWAGRFRWKRTLLWIGFCVISFGLISHICYVVRIVLDKKDFQPDFMNQEGLSKGLGFPESNFHISQNFDTSHQLL